MTRPAQPEDAPAIAAMLRRLMEETGMRPYTIYGCDGLTAYVRDAIERFDGSGPTGEGTCFLIYEAEGAPVGVGEWRTGTPLFWNQHYLDPAYRRRGLGRILLRDALRSLAGDAAAPMLLDAFAHNHGSRRWLAAMGFRPVGEQVWETMDLPADTDTDEAPHADEAQLHGLAEADRTHRRYGFSRFEVETASGRHGVGRLGTGWFRTTDRALLADRAALATLRRLDPARRLLCIDAEGFTPPALAPETVARSIRFAGDTAAIAARLDAALAP